MCLPDIVLHLFAKFQMGSGSQGPIFNKGCEGGVPPLSISVLCMPYINTWNGILEASFNASLHLQKQYLYLISEID